jgi:hypothetical protein
MKNIIITESQFSKIVNKMKKTKLSESDNMGLDRYMFFSNLEQIKRQSELLLQLDPTMVEQILQDGHDWADDHISVSKENMDQVFDFMMNKTKNSMLESEDDVFSIEPNVRKTPREYELSTVFGKYSDKVSNDVLRYMRKNPQLVMDTLYVLYGDDLQKRLEKSKNKIKR